MAPKKPSTDAPSEGTRRSTRIAEKPKTPVEEKPAPKPRVKKAGKKREAEVEGEAATEEGERQAKKVNFLLHRCNINHISQYIMNRLKETEMRRWPQLTKR